MLGAENSILKMKVLSFMVIVQDSFLSQGLEG